jgi:hypothetical protein
MKSWQVFKSSTPMYLCTSPNSAFMQKDNVLIAKSGVDDHSCNFAIIENSNPEVQKKIIQQNFKCHGLIFALQENKTAIDSWAEELGFKYFGRVPLMNKKQEKVDAPPKYYDNIRVERVTNNKLLQDFVKIFSSTRNISEKDGSKMFSEEIFSSDYFFYVAYYLNQPAGIFIAINTKHGAIVADADVKKQFQNSNILKVLSERAFVDVLANDLYDYSVVPTSQFAYNVVMQYGFVTEGYCDVWQKIREGELNG